MSVARAYSYQAESAADQCGKAHSAGRQVDFALRAKCFAMVVMICALASFVTLRSEALMRNGYTLVVLKQQLTQVEKENEILRLEIAKQKSPERIQNIAMTELGLVAPQQVYCAQSEGAAPQSAAVAKASTRETGVWERILGLFGQGKVEAAIRPSSE